MTSHSCSNFQVTRNDVDFWLKVYDPKVDDSDFQQICQDLQERFKSGTYPPSVKFKFELQNTSDSAVISLSFKWNFRSVIDWITTVIKWPLHQASMWLCTINLKVMGDSLLNRESVPCHEGERNSALNYGGELKRAPH